MNIPYVIYDPNTGEIMGGGSMDELSYEATKEANPSLHFLIGLGVHPKQRVDLATLTIVDNETERRSYESNDSSPPTDA